MAKKILTHHLSVPLSGATAAKIDIDMIDGNLLIDRHTGDELVLASGSLQYLEHQGLPTQSVTTNNDRTAIAIKACGKGQPWFRFPWSACNGATAWLIHINPTVSSDIEAHTGGGNIKLDLDGMALTHLLAETGGGNIEIILPGKASGLHVDATTGAGNLVVQISEGTPARIQATSGLGKVLMSPRFIQIDKNTYQSGNYIGSVHPVEIILKSGAGNVSVDERIVQDVAAAIRI